MGSRESVFIYYGGQDVKMNEFLIEQQVSNEELGREERK